MRKNKRLSSEVELAIITDYLNKLGPGSDIAPKYGITDVTVYNVLRRNGVSAANGSVRLPNKKQDYFSLIDTVDKAYLVGLIAADGYIIDNGANRGIQIYLQSQDKSVLEFYSSLILSKNIVANYPARKHSKYNLQPVSRLTLYGKQFVSDLKAFRLGPNKSFTCDPKISLLSEDLFRAFLLGLHDGDGSLFMISRPGRKMHARFSLVCSEPLSVTIRDMVSKYLNVHFSVAKKICQKGSLMYLIVNDQNTLERLLHWLYLNPIVCMNRKKQIYLDFIKLRERIRTGVEPTASRVTASNPAVRHQEDSTSVRVDSECVGFYRDATNEKDSPAGESN